MSTEIQSIIDGFMARNKALYGDLRMEATEGTDPEEKAPEGAPEAAPEAPEEKTEEKSKDDDLPEWARKELTNVRAEAANYRTKLREAEQKLSDAKSPEEVATAIKELREQNESLSRQILVKDVASKHGLPNELADVLKGDTEADLVAHAKVLAKFAQAPAPEKLEGGLDPSDEKDGVLDPRKLAAQHRRY